ncbi:MAG: hypothetical protein ACI808_000486 [Paraglaciecola sp.]|jgi:hypothetical protein
MCKLFQLNAARIVTIYLAIVCLVYSSFLQAQVVDDVLVKQNKQGYEIEVKLFIPLRLQSYSPQKVGKTLEILLRPENFADPELSERIGERSNLSWDKDTGIPVREIVFDGEQIEAPSLIIRFAKLVTYTVRSSADLRSIIVKVDDPLPTSEEKVEIRKKVNSENLVTALKKRDPKRANLLDEANKEILDKNYSRAIQLFTKLRDISNDEVRQHVQELLGVARELNGQLAHAKAEYLQYLKDYPQGEDARRVKQRLNSLITAAEKPRERLQSGRRTAKQKKSDWNSQFYGSISQIYFRDETKPQDEESQLLRSDVTNDLDFVARTRKGDLDFRAQFIGSYREDLTTDKERSEFLPSIISIEGRHSGIGLYGRLGRQSRTTGGILGRFDGVHGAYELSSTMTVNGVFGYPVDTQNKTKVNTAQEFYGISFDFDNVWDGWDFNTFYITQDNAGIKDREAVGGEVRYFDTKKSFFTLLDYDVLFNDVNIFLLIGRWTVVDSTTMNLVVDYRNSPILTTTNAIQGQGVETLDALFDRFNEDELRQLAIDRTAKSKAITIGITHQLAQDLQIIAEMTATEFGETVASAGVEGNPSTGTDLFYSTQLIANKLLFDNDIMILGARYSDTSRSDTLSLSGNWRINVSREFRINPRIRVDYRKDKEDDDDRTLVRPFIRLDYRFKRWMKFEFDLGYEWLEDTFAGQSQTTTGYFLSVGYRAQF